MTRVVDWNGRDVPEGLRPRRLTREEEDGLREAMRSLDAGEGRSLDEVRGEFYAPRK